MTVPRNIVGPVVRQIRKEKGLTQAELCAKLNLLGWDIGRDTLAKLETQVRWVADFEILKLAEALQVEGTFILRRASKPAANANPR
jgi:transcriptional regulator with XRE-family HTH domain